MYNTMKLYEEIKNEMRSVLEAEENSLAWKQEARTRMRDVSTLISAAKKVNKGMEIDAKELVAEIRAELDKEAEEAAAVEDAADPDEDYPSIDTPEA